MLQGFRSSFEHQVDVILDCFEMFLDHPSSLLPRASTWSSQKHHHTVKILHGITPQGTMSYYVGSVGGIHVSDKRLTENCRILVRLLPTLW